MFEPKKKPAYVDKMDPEVISLCDAINALPGLETCQSCCGHGKKPFCIWFGVRAVDDLLPLLYRIEHCHSGLSDWTVEVYTGCSRERPTFMLKGPIGDYQGAQTLATFLIQEGMQK